MIVVTGILNTVLVFALSLGLQSALVSIAGKKEVFGDSGNNMIPPVDLAPPIIPAVRVDSYSSLGGPLRRQASSLPGPTVPISQDRVQSYVSESTTLTNNPPSIHSVVGNNTGVERAVSPLSLPPLEQPPLIQQQDGMPQTISERIYASAQRVACFAASSPVMCCSLLAIPLVGIPVSLAAHNDTSLDTFILVFLWTGTLAAQAAVRRTSFSFGLKTNQGRARARSVLATLLNAVLWSSLGTIAYLAAKASARHYTIDDALSAFSTGTTLADVIAGTSHGGRLGAGDLAAAVLDAGIVSWGLKLFECRAQLLSRAGLTTLIVGAVFAVANIACGPLLVHSMGLASPAKELSFAARSVTLALAGPAMTNLGGDVGLNAAMVVFNGIVFQVAMGLGVCRWASRVLTAAEDRWQQCSEAVAGELSREGTPDSSIRCRMGSGCWRSQSETESDTDSDTETATDIDTDGESRPVTAENASQEIQKPAAALTVSPSGDQDVEKTAGQSALSSSSSSSSSSSPASSRKRTVSYTRCGDSCVVHVHMRGGAASLDELNSIGVEDDSPGTVAAGMTVGINAAAMGTAYLYEDASRAAPYAALSMTVFGVMTVVFTSIQPLASWVVMHVG